MNVSNQKNTLLPLIYPDACDHINTEYASLRENHQDDFSDVSSEVCTENKRSIFDENDFTTLESNIFYIVYRTKQKLKNTLYGLTEETVNMFMYMEKWGAGGGWVGGACGQLFFGPLLAFTIGPVKGSINGFLMSHKKLKEKILRDRRKIRGFIPAHGFFS